MTSVEITDEGGRVLWRGPLTAVPRAGDAVVIGVGSHTVRDVTFDFVRNVVRVRTELAGAAP